MINYEAVVIHPLSFPWPSHPVHHAAPMRPASLALLIAGAGLLLGTALVASFRIPFRVEDITVTATGHDDNPIVCIHRNIWGQPLQAMSEKFVTMGADQKVIGWTIEAGPYPDGVRQGKWRRLVHAEGKPNVESDIWYLDGREVTAAEWEQRR